ncbi:MAG TPA: hypothetical protein VF808_06335 [Ktedonobacterales bacterium]
MRRMSGLEMRISFMTLAALATLTLAGCSGAGAASAPTPATTVATVISNPTATAAATSQPTSSPGCDGSFAGAAFDGMLVGSTAYMGNTAYPEGRVPDSAPLAPYNTNSFNGSGAPTDVQVNPIVDQNSGGYVIVLCNTSGHTRRIDGVTVTLATLTPFTGALRIWKPCVSSYDAQGHKVITAGCGGANIQNDYMRASFPSGAGAGAMAVARMVEVSPALDPVLGPLPVTLQPNQRLSIDVVMTGLTGPATYGFSFALSVDGAAPRVVATSQPTLLAPPTQTWNGENCQAPTMQAMMPSSGFFVCPPAS